CRDLSREVAAFLDGRRRVAPPPPRPADWDRGEARVLEFENETAEIYNGRFDARVRVAHDLLSLRNLRDRDLDEFYRSPANSFQTAVVAQRLDRLAERLHRDDAAMALAP